jgi:hypothetical protein
VTPPVFRGFFFSRMKICAWALWLQASLRFISTEWHRFREVRVTFPREHAWSVSSLGGDRHDRRQEDDR